MNYVTIAAILCIHTSRASVLVFNHLIEWIIIQNVHVFWLLFTQHVRQLAHFTDYVLLAHFIGWVVGEVYSCPLSIGWVVGGVYSCQLSPLMACFTCMGWVVGGVYSCPLFICWVVGEVYSCPLLAHFIGWVVGVVHFCQWLCWFFWV